MFYNCTGLLELNLSGWDFSKIGGANLSSNMDIATWYGVSLRKLNMTNTKFT
jgi:surface protein